MNDRGNESRQPARSIALEQFSLCRRPSRRIAAVGLLVLWPIVTSAFAGGGSAALKNHPAANKGKNILIVRVTSDGKPVAGAEVAANFINDLPTAVTDHDGLARVPLPAGGKINGLVALHPPLGVGAHHFGFPT